VVVAPGEPALAAAATAAAERHLERDGPKAQFLVVNLPGLSENGDYVGAGLREEDRAIADTLGWLKPSSERLSAAGSDAETVCFDSPIPQEDLVRVATEWAATDAVVGREEDAEALEAAGIDVQRVRAPEPASA
jgi:hypothetical protein